MRFFVALSCVALSSSIAVADVGNNPAGPGLSPAVQLDAPMPAANTAEATSMAERDATRYRRSTKTLTIAGVTVGTGAVAIGALTYLRYREPNDLNGHHPGEALLRVGLYGTAVTLGVTSVALLVAGQNRRRLADERMQFSVAPTNDGATAIWSGSF